jgi:hypothetical protein
MRVINFAYLHNALDARVTVQRQGNCFVSSVVFQEQIQRILNDGVDSGIYRIRQINLAAKSVLEAMVGFGHLDRVTKFAGDPRTSDVRRLFRLSNGKRPALHIEIEHSRRGRRVDGSYERVPRRRRPHSQSRDIRNTRNTRANSAHREPEAARQAFAAPTRDHSLTSRRTGRP